MSRKNRGQCREEAAVAETFILSKLRSGDMRRVLFIPTGALLSQVSFNEGKSVPGIAHGIVLESVAK